MAAHLRTLNPLNTAAKQKAFSEALRDIQEDCVVYEKFLSGSGQTRSKIGARVDRY